VAVGSDPYIHGSDRSTLLLLSGGGIPAFSSVATDLAHFSMAAVDPAFYSSVAVDQALSTPAVD